MKAIVQDKYGSPDNVLELQDIDKPVVKDGEVLVRVHAASVHVGDWVLMRGVPYIMRMASGLLIGYQRFGSIPPSVVCLALPALVFMEMGLLRFMAGVGLTAEKDIVGTILSSGPGSGCSRRGCDLNTGCRWLPFREIRPEDGAGAAHGHHHRLDCKQRAPEYR